MPRLVLMLLLVPAMLAGSPWKRHTIDASEKGADGVRLQDVNGDSLPDIATGWEESGVVRIYLHPGSEKVTQAWPAVTVGQVASPEDAVFVDIDGDGVFEVVSSTEGDERTLYIHQAPRDGYEDPERWTTRPIVRSQGKGQWMFVVPLGRGRQRLDGSGRRSEERFRAHRILALSCHAGRQGCLEPLVRRRVGDVPGRA